MNHYFRNGLVAFTSVLLINACQHFNESKKTVVISATNSENKEFNSSKNQERQSEIISEKSEKDNQIHSKLINSQNTAVLSKYSKVFEDFGDGESQSKLRSELLQTMLKPGELVTTHRNDKKEREKISGKEISGIEEMASYRRAITMPIGTNKMLYEDGYLLKEYDKALQSPILSRVKSNRLKSATTYSINNVTFTERGPNNIPGRDRSIVVSPTNPNKWYVGSVGGGVWITENAGTTWRNTTDYTVPSLATSTVAISPADANVVYVGTGEPFNNLDALNGVGILKSTDAGETWIRLASTTTIGSVGRLLVNPTNANHVVAGTSNGIYVTTDGGTTWTRTFSGGTVSTGTVRNTQDVVANNDFSAIFAAVNTYGVVKSTDGGTTWTRVFDAPSKNKDIRRIEIGIAPSDNTRIILSASSNITSVYTGSIYLSDDSGATFTELAYNTGDSKEILSDQGWYNNVVTFNPIDKNIVYVGGVYVAKVTIDAANSKYNVLQIASGYDTTKLNPSVHPDQHGLVCQVNPNNSAQFRMILTNDGGVYYTAYKTNPGETQGDWSSVIGLNTTQFYGADKKKGEDVYLAGAQDNGSSVTVTNPSGAASNYKLMLGGDGFEVIWNYKDPNKLLFGSQYNNFVRSLTGTGTGLTLPSRFFARNADYGRGKSPFYSKMANANNNADVVFTPSVNGVWRTPDFGATWLLTPFTVANNGTWYGAESPATVKVSVANPDVVWAASAVSAGTGTSFKVNLSRDNGFSFAKTTGSFPTTGNYYISGLAASSVNEASAYVLFSATNQPKVVKTTDFGVTWTDISGFDGTNSTSTRGFPNVSVHSVLEMPFDTNVIWAGTDIGIFETVDGGANWYLVTNLPPVSIWNMKIVDNQVVLATHGRGIWTATIPELNNYVLPEYTAPPVVKSASQAGIHDNKIKAVFNYTDNKITALKVYEDNVYVTTISSTLPNTDYNYTSSASFAEGSHTISVSGVYMQNSVEKETIKLNKSVEIVNFGTGVSNVNLPSIATSDVYIGAGKFVIDNVSGKFGYNVLNNSGHPYLDRTTYQTYLRTPIIVGSTSKMVINHMALTEKDYDFAIVEASKDLQTWTTVGSYDEGTFANWTGVTAANVSETLFNNNSLDFTSKFAAGDEVAVRLRLTSDAATTGYGWIIKSIIPDSALNTKDVSVNNRVLLTPNPAGETTSLMLPDNAKGIVEIYVYDASGRMVTSFKKNASSKVDLDVSKLNKGLYLVLVKTDTIKQALKLIKD